MNYRLKIIALKASLLPALMLLAASCSNKPSDLARQAVIPKPVSVVSTGGYFKLEQGTSVLLKGDSPEIRNIAAFLADHLRPATGFPFQIKTTRENKAAGNIIFTLSNDSVRLGEEGYSLSVTTDSVNVCAKNPAGLFRAVQTIRQLLPAEIELGTVQRAGWQIPTGTISDFPVYPYRGTMLDVSRHFFKPDVLKKYIDQIAYYKLNYLHLHLSDDQGWRIEIKSRPELTNRGGSTQVGGGRGGFFTQEQYTDIVNYARERFVTIVPEIDMPGHTNAALASYAELNCDNKKRDLYTGTEVGFSTFCTRKPEVYKFLSEVIKELASLTPGPYIHIGGDESHATKKEDYIPFMEKVQDIVIAHGKQAIAWDEIATVKMRRGTVAQDWASVKNAAEAVSKGAKLLMSPALKAYIDMQYDSTSKYGLHWAAYIEVDSAYLWDPARMIPGVGRENIIGVEAPLWSETITNLKEIDYLAFPRLAGIAEIGWTPEPLRSWNDYKTRLASHGPRMKALGIDYYPSRLIQWEKEKGDN